MAEFFDKWNPQQFTLLVMTVGIAVAVIVLILSITHYQLRSLADRSALEKDRVRAGFTLRQDLVRRGLPAGELKSALDALGLEAGAGLPAEGDAEVTGRVLTGLLACNQEAVVSAEEVEQTVAAVMAADPAVRRAVVAVLDDAAENEYPGEAVFATVRAMCQAAVRKPESAAPRPDVELQFAGG